MERGYGLAAHAAARPDKPAMIVGDRTLTYGEFDRRTNQLANVLVASGIGPGDRVAAMLPNGWEYFEIMHAVGRIQATMVPINFHFRREEIAYILDDSSTKLVVTHGNHLAEVEPAIGGRSCLVTGRPAGSRSYELALADAPTEPPRNAVLRHGFNVMIYTSGTTGRPKGVIHPTMEPEIGYQAQTMMATMWGFTSDDVHLVVGPLYHTAPGGYGFLHLFLGATLVIMTKFDAEEALRLIESHRVTTTHMVPVNFIRILDLPEATRGRYDVSSLRRVLHAAAPCPEEVKRHIMEFFPRDSVWEYYGATEGAGTVISPEEWRRKPGSVGKPWPTIELKILDESGHPLPPRKVGLIYLSPMGGRPGFRYHNAAEKTDAAYRGKFFTVGDMGYVDEDGYLFISDRKIDMVISGGVNIYPREIEEALHRHPSVADVAVFGVPDAHWGETVKAVVEARKGTKVAADDLAAFCKQHLAAYKCPRSFDFVDELPRDPNGKVLKRKLRDRYWQGRTRQV
jgi:long-chain acyl-CoA synthetase